MSVVATMDSKRCTDEVRHVHEDLEHFYLEARRNRLLAQWAAKQLDLNANDYFLLLLDCDISIAGPKPVADKIIADFAANDIDLGEEEVWAKLQECEQQALHSMLQKQAEQVEADVLHKVEEEQAEHDKKHKKHKKHKKK